MIQGLEMVQVLWPFTNEVSCTVLCSVGVLYTGEGVSADEDIAPSQAESSVRLIAVLDCHILE